eukprot:1153364-Pelagomonas_calceolata.AAC.2
MKKSQQRDAPAQLDPPRSSEPAEFHWHTCSEAPPDPAFACTRVICEAAGHLCEETFRQGNLRSSRCVRHSTAAQSRLYLTIPNKCMAITKLPFDRKFGIA